jgi:hypothetical protein
VSGFAFTSRPSPPTRHRPVCATLHAACDGRRLPSGRWSRCHGWPGAMG